MKAPEGGGSRVGAIGAALVVLTLAAFSGVRENAFLNYDDNVYVTANPHVLSGLSPANVRWAFTTFDAANWHPVTWLSHMLDVEAFGLDAGRHHLVSLLLHAANGVLLFLLLWRMTGAVWRPALVAALFSVHPLHVESVAWLAERKDVLSTLFWLLTVAAWLRWLESKTAARYALSVALFATGLMSKPMLVTLPLTLMLLDYWPLKRTALVPLWREKAGLLAMSLASAIVTVAAQRGGGAIESLETIAFPVRLANAVASYAGYLGKTAWPSSLSCFYPLFGDLNPWTAAGSALLIAGVTALAVRLARRAPYFAFGWAWYLVTLVPVIGLVQVGAQASADRYTYVPLVGVFVAIAWGLGDLANVSSAARAVVPAAAAVWIAILLVVTRTQVGFWAGNEALFTHALAVTPDNWLARNNLGGMYEDEGRNDDAMAQFVEVVRIRPGLAKGQYNLALALSRSGRFPEAIERYGEALRLNPGLVEAHYNLGLALDHQNRTEEAVASYRKVIELAPGRANAWTNLGVDLHALGRKDEALQAFLRADELQPGVASTHVNIGLERQALGQFEEAAAAFEKATREKPGDADLLAYLALAYQNGKQLDKAAAAYREAIRLNPALVVCRYNLGILALKAGDVAGADEQKTALGELDEKLAGSLGALIRAHGAAESR